MTTNYAVAPGEYLEEWIDDEELPQQRVAEMLGCSRKQVNDLIHGRAPVTQSTAIALERVTGIPANSWLRFETAYRADLARIADEEGLAQHADKIASTTAAYLRKIGATKATRTKPGQLVSDFLTFHRCGTWEAYEAQHQELTTGDYALAALKDSKATLDQSTLATWLRAAELTEAFERGRAFTYDAEGLEQSLPVLRNRAARPDGTMLRDIAGLLADVGVIFLVVDPPERFPLLGMTRWIDKRVPVIQQTGRWKRDGFVIWTLFHEIGHVLHDPRGEMHWEYSTDKKRTSAAEKAANKFAFDTLFGDAGLEPFRDLTRDGEIARAARQVGVSPGVVVHQLQRRTLLDRRFGHKLFVDLSGTFTA